VDIYLFIYIFDFLLDIIDKDLIREANNNLIRTSNELYVLAILAILVKIKFAKQTRDQ